MPIAGRRLTSALAVALVLCGCSTRDGNDPLATSQVTEVPRTTPAQPTDAGPGSPDPASTDPAPPDPAPADPAPPDPAPADPAPPDPAPAPPDPAPPDPAPPAPDPAAVEAAAGDAAAQEATAGTESPMAVACAEVVAEMTEAVMTYETLALAEGGGEGDRVTAAAEMREAWYRAQAAADEMGAGLPSAAAPALAELTALHDGLGTRAVLDESDADPWRAAREDLQSWCRTWD